MTVTLAIPQAGQLVGTWTIDSAHSSVEATVRHMMISTVRGHFDTFGGSIVIGESIEDSAVEATIDAASINTSNPDRDAHLRSPDFLDVESNPTITFKSTKLERTSDTGARLYGEFTMRGVTRPLTLDVVFNDHMEKDLFGKERLSFTATGSLRRSEFGASWNQALETGGLLVSDEVKITLEVAAVR